MSPPPDPNSPKRPGLARRFYTWVKNSVLAVRGVVKPIKTAMDVFLKALKDFPKLIAGKSFPRPRKVLSPNKACQDKKKRTCLTLLQAIENPKTAAQFKQNLDIIVQESGLGKLYPPDDEYLNKVAARAAELRDDPNNPLNKPEQIGTLTRLALYQPILYCGNPNHYRSHYAIKTNKCDLQMTAAL